MADELNTSNATPAPEAPTTSANTNPSAPAASQGVAPTTEAAQPEQRRDTIARVLADKRAEGGDTSLRDRLIAEGKIRPAAEKPATQIGAKPGDRSRDGQGRFAGGVKAGAVTPAGTPNATATIAAPAQTAAAPERPALPKWLAKDLEPVWNQGQPELLASFLKYGEDAHRGVEKHKSAAQQHESLMAEFKPYEQIMRAENATPQTAIRGLLKTSAILRTGDPAQKAHVVAQTMQQFGVSLPQLAQMFGAQIMDAHGQPIQQPQLDPQVLALRQELNSLKGSIQSQQQAAQQAETARVAKIAESFGKERPHYEQLKPQIGRILSAGLVEDAEAKSDIEILQAAYDIALRMNPTLHEQHLAQERERAAQAERDKANQAAQASRAAAVQVRGAPGSPSLPAVDPKDRRSAIRHAIAVHSR